MLQSFNIFMYRVGHLCTKILLKFFVVLEQFICLKNRSFMVLHSFPCDNIDILEFDLCRGLAHLDCNMPTHTQTRT